MLGVASVLGPPLEMIRHTLKILLQMLQDFYSVSDHFGTLSIKGLEYQYLHNIFRDFFKNLPSI